MKSVTKSRRHDLLSNPLFVLAFFCLPVIAIVVTGQNRVSLGWRTTVWTIALSIMGTACLVNAARCGRVHCYITGPFFLLMAAVSLLFGVGLIPLGAHGWSLISVVILVGAVVFTCLPELFLGRYRKDRVDGSDRC